MQEETKEEFLGRMKKEQGLTDPSEELFIEEAAENRPVTFKSRLKSLLFLILLGLFFYAILLIFGMLKSN